MQRLIVNLALRLIHVAAHPVLLDLVFGKPDDHMKPRYPLPDQNS